MDDLSSQLERLVIAHGIEGVEERLAIVKAKFYPPLTEEQKKECLRAVYSVGGINAA